MGLPDMMSIWNSVESNSKQISQVTKQKIQKEITASARPTVTQKIHFILFFQILLSVGIDPPFAASELWFGDVNIPAADSGRSMGNIYRIWIDKVAFF